MKTPTTQQPGRPSAAPGQCADMSDWNGADFDSLEVLTSINVPVAEAVTLVCQARQGHGQERAR